MLLYLYRYRGELGDGLSIDPYPGASAGALARVRENEIPRWPSTPDVIAVPLIQRAIEFISSCAVPLLNAREIYAQVYSDVRRCGYTKEVWRKRGALALERLPRHAPRCAPGELTRGARQALERALRRVLCGDLLFGWCTRASEILQLRVGCLESSRAMARPTQV